MSVATASRNLSKTLNVYTTRAPIGKAEYILNPLDYAAKTHDMYCKRFAPRGHRVEALLLGMNPGPWGMAQTGVPFGSPDFVTSFLGITGKVKSVSHTHPKRPILGFESTRTEVSGQRLWGGIEKCFGSPENFFERFFIANFCPLVFQSDTGANVTPDKLPANEWANIIPACDKHLVEVIETLKPEMVIGIGRWATNQMERVVKLGMVDVEIGNVLHPSPASPAANKGWLETARSQFEKLGHPWPHSK